MEQEKELKAQEERRAAAMRQCVLYQNQLSEKLAKEPETLNKSKLAERNALIMELEIKKHRVMDYETILNFRQNCKISSWGKAGKAGALGEFVDYKSYEDEDES